MCLFFVKIIHKWIYMAVLITMFDCKDNYQYLL